MELAPRAVLLPPSRGDIVGAGVPQDGAVGCQGVVRREVFGWFGDDDGEFGFVVGLFLILAAAWDDDGFFVDGECHGIFGEEHWALGDIGTAFGGVVGVVAPDAYDPAEHEWCWSFDDDLAGSVARDG